MFISPQGLHVVPLCEARKHRRCIGLRGARYIAWAEIGSTSALFRIVYVRYCPPMLRLGGNRSNRRPRWPVRRIPVPRAA